MTPNSDRLLRISSVAISRHSPTANNEFLQSHGRVGKDLLSLLVERNGFYAFESSLHVLPLGDAHGAISLERWNSLPLWRCEYEHMTDGMLFFAEDAFGNQFCINRESICVFNAETGLTEAIADTLDEWAGRILTDYRSLTGYPLLHTWQAKEGALPIGCRLMPKIPFVLGGEYGVGNLYALSSVSVMKTCGNLARQIKDLPDGADIEFRVIE